MLAGPDRLDGPTDRHAVLDELGAFGQIPEGHLVAEGDGLSDRDLAPAAHCRRRPAPFDPARPTAPPRPRRRRHDGRRGRCPSSSFHHAPPTKIALRLDTIPGDQLTDFFRCVSPTARSNERPIPPRTSKIWGDIGMVRSAIGPAAGRGREALWSPNRNVSTGFAGPSKGTWAKGKPTGSRSRSRAGARSCSRARSAKRTRRPGGRCASTTRSSRCRCPSSSR